MALTSFQRHVLGLLRETRRSVSGGYVAGGLALNHMTAQPRASHDIDFFHDPDVLLKESFNADCRVLKGNGYKVERLKESDSFIEAGVSGGDEFLKIQWVKDSPYRFFPLQENDVVGFTLHPVDLATNKLLALAGRTVPRDWIDVIAATKEVQPLAYLLFAACGKDPGFSPTSLLELVSRRHYNQIELDNEIDPKGAYDAADLCRYWHEEVNRAKELLEVLPREKVGQVVLGKGGNPFRGGMEEFRRAYAAGELQFHEGGIGGALPQITSKR